MKKLFVVFSFSLFLYSLAFSQSTLFQCQMQTSGTGTQTKLVNVTQPLVMVYVDFKD